MSHMKRNCCRGLITIHTPFSISLLISEEHIAALKDTAESRRSRSSGSADRGERPGNRKDAAPAGPKSDPRWDRYTYPSLRQLQAKMEAENQQVKAIIQPLQDTGHTFLKLDSFLSQRDVMNLRRRELLHKRWTEHVWFPLQSRLEGRAASPGSVETKRRRSSCSRYLHQSSTKVTPRRKIMLD
ncbi:protein FAM228A [Pholidichthys leucotaenia]